LSRWQKQKPEINVFNIEATKICCLIKIVFFEFSRLLVLILTSRYRPAAVHENVASSFSSSSESSSSILLFSGGINKQSPEKFFFGFNADYDENN
jgi:hypothetical protein